MELLEPDILLQLLIGGLLAGALYALLACGLNLIFGVMRVISLTHAELMLIGAFGAYVLYSAFGIHPLVSLFLIVPVMFVAGYYFQRVLIERVVERPMLDSLLATYGVSIILVNIGLLVFTADFKSVPVLQGSFGIGDVPVSEPRAVAGLISVVLTVGVYLFLERTRLGKAIRAVSEHAQVASICGIDVRRIRMLAFGLASAMAGAAGVMLSVIYSFWPGSGIDFIQKAFAIIIIGGMGNFVGALYGGILLGIVESFVGAFVSTQWGEAMAYVLLVAVLLIRPTGLKGAARA